jgi:hypothetical protein
MDTTGNYNIYKIRGRSVVAVQGTVGDLWRMQRRRTARAAAAMLWWMKGVG